MCTASIRPAAPPDDGDPAAIQDYIRRHVRPGDPVTLTAMSAGPGEEPTYYWIHHNDHCVGITSEACGSSLYRTLQRYPAWRVRMPVQIDSLTVEDVDTAVGLPSAGRRAGLGPTGLWLRVRVAGWGRLQYPRAAPQE